MQQLPAIKILSDNFLKDLTFLNATFEKRKIGDINSIITKLKQNTGPITEKFKILSDYIKNVQENKPKEKISQNERQIMQGLILYTTSYIAINNSLYQIIQENKKENNDTINLTAIISGIVHKRYQEFLPVFKKQEYQNEYAKLLVPKMENALTTKNVKELNEVEVEINQLTPLFVQGLVKKNLLTRKDDFAFACFSIRTQTAAKMFQALFASVTPKNQDQAPTLVNGKGETEQPTDPNRITFQAPKNKKILTKDIPMNGKPKDWKK